MGASFTWASLLGEGGWQSVIFLGPHKQEQWILELQMYNITAQFWKLLASMTVILKNEFYCTTHYAYEQQTAHQCRWFSRDRRRPTTPNHASVLPPPPPPSSSILHLPPAQGTFSSSFLQQNSWNSLTVWVLTVQTRHSLVGITWNVKAYMSNLTLVVPWLSIICSIIAWLMGFHWSHFYGLEFVAINHLINLVKLSPPKTGIDEHFRQLMAPKVCQFRTKFGKVMGVHKKPLMFLIIMNFFVIWEKPSRLLKQYFVQLYSIFIRLDLFRQIKYLIYFYRRCFSN